MAWSFAALAGYETARAALDKPLVAVNVIPISPAQAKWVDDGSKGVGSIATWVDRSATANPARRAYDGYPGYITKHSGVTTDDIYYYAVDLGALKTFDCAFLTGHNAGTLSLVNNLVLQIADDNDFSTSLTTIADFSKPADDDRLADLVLGHAADAGRAHDVGADAGPNRYTAQYVWLKFDKTGTNIIPEIGELVLARRRQLEYLPDRPFDEYALSEDAGIAKTRGGILHKVNHSRRGFMLDGEFAVDTDTYIDDWVQFFRDCRGPFVWVYKPNSAPAAWHFMMREGPLGLPREQVNMRRTQILAEEQGPGSYYLDVEENG